VSPDLSLLGALPCEECDDGLEYPTPSFSESHPLPVPCPSCNGVGFVPDSATRETMAEAIMAITSGWTLGEYGPSVLARAVWEALIRPLVNPEEPSQ
jgi:hypothetical protein